MMYRRFAIWSLLSLALMASMLAVPVPARARSIVLHSEPVDGAVLRQAPAMAHFWFDSAAIIEPDAVHLTDADGNDLALPDFHSDIYKPNSAGLQGLFDPTFLFFCSLGLNSYPTMLMVDLPKLGPGTYRLSWRAIAINDKRATTGSLVFAVDPEAPATPSADAQTLSTTTMASDLMVTMAIRPNRPGANFVSLQAAPVRRPLRAPIGQITLRLTPPNGAPREVALAPAADGSYQASGDLIDRPGSWTAELHVGRGTAPETRTSMTWEVPDDSAGSSLLWIAAALGGLALLGGGLLVMRRRAA
jgi:methionine-rich copper-binding protein CopC